MATLVALGLAGAPIAGAANCGSSAGDTQYVDPLACGGGSGAATGGSSSHRSTPATPATPTTPAVTPVAAQTTPTAAPATATAPTTTAADPGTTTLASGPSGQQLPYTGLDLRAVLAAGIVLLAAGLVLWRLTGRLAGHRADAGPDAPRS